MKIRFGTIIFSLFLFFMITLGANVAEAAISNPGDIAFIMYDSDGDDNFAFVVLADVPASTTIYFTDNEWTGAGFNTGEGFITWVSPASVLVAGETIQISTPFTTPSASQGTATKSASFGLSNSNEILYAYIGADTATPTTLLAAVASDGLTNGSAVLTGSGLTENTDAANLGVMDSDLDNANYIGPRAGEAVFSDYLPLINDMTVMRDTSNWSVADGGGSPATAFSLSPTAIELSSFIAIAQADGSVDVEWVTASETDHAGFNIHRSDTEAGAMTKVNNAIVASEGVQGQGSSYSLTDQAATVGTQWYTLEDIDIHGVSTLHGPISVEVRTPTAVSLSGINTTAGMSSGLLLTITTLIISLAIFTKLTYSRQLKK